MPLVYGNCDTPVTPPVCDACGIDRELGGVRGVAFIHASVMSQIQANPSDAVLWNTLITSGKILMIPETRGTFDSEPNTIPGFGNKSETLSSFTHTLEFDDPNYKNNCGFYNSIIGNDKYYVAFISASTMRISDKTVEVTPTSPITDDVKELVMWHAIAVWDSLFIPCPVDTPESTFQCNDGTSGTIFPIDTGDGALLEDGNGGLIVYA